MTHTKESAAGSRASGSGPETVLVTGGMGLLGGALVRRLLEAGDTVRLLCRPRAGQRLPSNGSETALGDLRDERAVREAVKGVRAVYHLAAVTRKWLPDRRVFREVNVDAAIHLARAAAEAGVERVVHVSSFTVFGPSPDDGTRLDETAACCPEQLQNDYQRSKGEAHRALVELAADDGLPVVIACPGVLYGEADPRHANPVAELVQRQLRGRLHVVPGGGHKVWTFSYLHDVAAGLRQARQLGRSGEVFLLGGETRPLRDVFVWLGAAGAKRGPRFSPPLWPFLAAGSVAELTARVARLSPRFTASALRFLEHHWSFGSDRAIDRLGYTITPLAHGLAAIWKDLHERRLVSQAPPPSVSAA